MNNSHIPDWRQNYATGQARGGQPDPLQPRRRALGPAGIGTVTGTISAESETGGPLRAPGTGLIRLLSLGLPATVLIFSGWLQELTGHALVALTPLILSLAILLVVASLLGIRPSSVLRLIGAPLRLAAFLAGSGIAGRGGSLPWSGAAGGRFMVRTGDEGLHRDVLLAARNRIPHGTAVRVFGPWANGVHYAWIITLPEARHRIYARGVRGAVAWMLVSAAVTFVLLATPLPG